MQSDIYTVKQIAESIPALTEGAIRWQLFNRENNGLSQSGAIVRNGRRIFIDLPMYIAWLKGDEVGYV